MGRNVVTKSRRIAHVTAAVILTGGHLVAGAEERPNPISIYLHSVDARDTAPVETVALSDGFFTISVEATPAVPGSHEIAATLYDPTGKQVLRASIEEEPRKARLHLSVGYNLKKDDPIGAWRIVATLDGGPLAERVLQVSTLRAVHE